MLSYAGIGTREITEKEQDLIIGISNKLSKKFIVYSGNAEGSDIAFQLGSNKQCVLFLPWASFNIEKYALHDSLDWYDMGHSQVGLESIDKYHPNKNLSRGAKMMMARNYHQVVGWEKYPIVSFVICCADEDDEGNILGGTGQACRIAKDLVIPVINIRKKGWSEKLNKSIQYIKENKNE